MENDGRDAKVDLSKPLFIVVEAMRTTRFFEHSSQAELIGQLKGQLIRSYIPFRFYLPDKFLYSRMSCCVDAS